MIIYSKSCIFIALLIFAYNGIGCRNIAPKNTNLRIQSGRDSPIGEYPYVVRMEVVYEHTTDNAEVHTKSRVSCTGAQIAPAWSLTAAHCIVGIPELIAMIEQFSRVSGVKAVVRYWEVGGLSLNKTSDILKMFGHPNYDSQKNNNDIGLLKTNDVHMKNYGKISAADHNTLIGLKATLLGFGRLNGTINGENVFKDTLILQKPLQVADVMIKKCEKKLMPAHDWFRTTFCSAAPCGSVVSSCPGDSGGPVIQGGQIVGVIVAGSSANCRKRSPKIDLFVYYIKASLINPVSPYLDWIALTIREFGS